MLSDTIIIKYEVLRKKLSWPILMHIFFEKQHKGLWRQNSIDWLTK